MPRGEAEECRVRRRLRQQQIDRYIDRETRGLAAWRGAYGGNAVPKGVVKVS